MRTPLTIGQVVYSLPLGNAARGKTPALTPTIVRKIGRKWLQCSTEEYPHHLKSFFIETGFEDGKGFTSESRIYLSSQEWADEYETERLRDEIAKTLDSWRSNKLSLTTLRQIKALIGEAEIP